MKRLSHPHQGKNLPLHHLQLHLLLIQQHPLHLQTPPASQRRRRLTLYSLCQLQCPVKLSRLHTTTLITRITLVGTTHHLTTHYPHLAILITTLQLPIMITDMEKTVGRGKHSAMMKGVRRTGGGGTGIGTETETGIGIEIGTETGQVTATI